MNKRWEPEAWDEHNRAAFRGNVAGATGTFRSHLENLGIDWNLWLQVEANELRDQLNLHAVAKMKQRPPSADPAAAVKMGASKKPKNKEAR